MRHAGPIDVLEAAYEIDRFRDPWLRAVVAAARPLMQPCIEAVGYFIDAAGPTIEGIVTTRDSRFRAPEVLDLLQHMPRDLMQQVHFRAARGVATLGEQVAEGSLGRPEFEEFLGRVARMGALAGPEMPRRVGVEGAFTPSETDILSAVARGMSNSATARARGTSARTVANQIATLFAKTGARSRAELAQVASRIGSPSARTTRT
jgi:DNA-binding NarL/FixJ family response regulator